MRIPSGKTDQAIYFVAVDATDLKTRETAITLGNFSAYRSRNGGAATAYTTPTFTELSAANMPGVYSLLIDEDTTIAAGSDSEEYVVHIKDSGGVMAPVTRTIELYRRDTTSGQTATITSGGVTLADAVSHGGTLGSSTATLALSRLSVVSQTAATTAVTITGNTTGNGAVITSGAGATGDGVQVTAGSTNGHGFVALGTGTGNGIKTTGGSTGNGIVAASGTGATGDGIQANAASTNGNGFVILGTGTGSGIKTTGGSTGHGINAASGAGATGNAINAAAASTNGNGLATTGTGTGNGILTTGGAGAGGDGLEAAAGGGVPIRGNITGNITGTIDTVTTLTNLPAITANWLTAAGTAADFGAEVAAAVWRDAVAADFTQAGSVGLSVMNGVALGTGLTVNACTTVNGLAANVITAAATAADFGAEVSAAVWRDAVAADFTQAGSIGLSVMNGVALGTGLTVAAVSGAVGSVTGNVGGNVTGTIGGLTAAALKDFFDTDSTTTYASAVAGSVVKEIADNAGGSSLTEAGIAAAVWDEQVDGTVTARQSARLLNSAAGGKASGLAGTNAKYRDLADTKDRIDATVDSNGNRTAVTRDLT